VGIYFDAIIYFSTSDKKGWKFETSLSSIVNVDLMGQISHFLGIEFTWKYHDDGYLTASLTQQSFADDLIEALELASFIISTFLTPYHSGLPIDSVLHGITWRYFLY
jgi:hypothetical protein